MCHTFASWQILLAVPDSWGINSIDTYGNISKTLPVGEFDSFDKRHYVEHSSISFAEADNNFCDT